MKAETGAGRERVKEKLTVVRTTGFEVGKIYTDAKETLHRWHDLSKASQEITNAIWQTWLAWHIEKESRQKVRLWVQAKKKWHETKKGRMPKLSLDAVPKQLAKHLYRMLCEEFPQVNSRVRALLQSIITKKIKARQAVVGSLPGWMAILLHRENLPSACRAQPIPFDRANSKLHEQEGTYSMELRLDRIAEKGKKNGISTLDRYDLYIRKWRDQSQVAILDRILTGEYKFCGSSIVYSKKKRKWFAQIAYRMPVAERADVIEGKTAYLVPARGRPWAMFCDGTRTYHGGRGRYAGAIRKQLITRRWSYSDNYRYAGSSNKGHGRGRATLPLDKLSQRWKDFTKTCNQTVASQVVAQCIQRQAGLLVYVQPVGSTCETRFLATAGKLPDRRDATGWDWHQMGKCLGDNCQKMGIEFRIEQSGSVVKRKV